MKELISEVKVQWGSKASTEEMFCKKVVFLEISQNS